MLILKSDRTIALKIALQAERDYLLRAILVDNPAAVRINKQRVKAARLALLNYTKDVSNEH